MKKIYLFLFMLFPLISCVDNDYDLSDIDDDNNQIGESFVIPMANVDIKGVELFDFDNLGSDGKVLIPETFDKTYDIKSGLGDDVTDWIGDNYDKVTMIAKVTNGLPSNVTLKATNGLLPNLTLKMNIKLFDENENELKVNGKSLIQDMELSAGEEDSLSYKITPDVIKNLNMAYYIKIYFEQQNVPKIDSLEINPDELFKIKLSLKKDGGLSF